MNIVRIFALSCALTIAAPSMLCAQFFMPLERLDGLNDSLPDLLVGLDPFNNLDFARMDHTTQNAPLDADDDFVMQSLSATSAPSATQAAAEGFTSTAVSDITTAGDIDNALTGQFEADDFSDWGFAGWSTSFRGVTEYEVLEHPNHPNPETITLRANLHAVATGVNGGTPFGQANGGAVNISIENVTGGGRVSLVAVFNTNTLEWEWTITDQFNEQINGTTEGGFNEGHYEEILVEVGDVIRISVDNSIWGFSEAAPTSQQWTSSATGWFDVVGED